MSLSFNNMLASIGLQQIQDMPYKRKLPVLANMALFSGLFTFGAPEDLGLWGNSLLWWVQNTQSHDLAFYCASEQNIIKRVHWNGPNTSKLQCK